MSSVRPVFLFEEAMEAYASMVAAQGAMRRAVALIAKEHDPAAIHEALRVAFDELGTARVTIGALRTTLGRP
jgi:hypothetical protein